MYFATQHHKIAAVPLRSSSPARSCSQIFEHIGDRKAGQHPPLQPRQTFSHGIDHLKKIKIKVLEKEIISQLHQYSFHFWIKP